MRFDLPAAREICTRIKGYEDPDAGNLAEFEAAALFPSALDRIAELEEALIEERANSVGSMAAMSGRLMDCIEAEKEARGQLHSEGKI